MTRGVGALSDREKVTLRLLLDGHDAKSSARELGLSVHTVNERLRDARRKLGVSSSREAARRLAEAEGRPPQSVGDKPFGVAGAGPGGPADERSNRRRHTGHALFWLSGGMLTMSVLIAAAVLIPPAIRDGEARSGPIADASPAPAIAGADRQAAEAARTWATMLDRRHWNESWDAAGTLFRSQLTREGWASTARSVREPLGPVTSRAIRSVTRTSSLPGVPAGDYELIEFATDFARRRGAVETVVLSREAAGWRVNGYFIR